MNHSDRLVLKNEKSVGYSPTYHDNLSTPKERCERDGCWRKNKAPLQVSWEAF